MAPLYTPDKIARMTLELAELYHETNTAQRVAGRTWYMRALDVCEAIAQRHALPVANVVNACAALSPQQPWETNIDLTRQLVNTGNAATLGACVRKARRCLAGDTSALVERTGPKTFWFARAILGDVNAVCIDRWVLRAVGHVASWTSPHQYKSIASAVTDAARLCGESPRDFQAIIWVYLRDGEAANALPF